MAPEGRHPIAHSLAKQTHTKPPPRPATPSWAQHIPRTQSWQAVQASHSAAPTTVHPCGLGFTTFLTAGSHQFPASAGNRPLTEDGNCVWREILQEASNTPLLLPRLEVRERGNRLQDTLQRSVELAKHLQRDSCDRTKLPFLLFCDRKSGSRVETRHPAAHSPRNPGLDCQPEAPGPGAPRIPAPLHPWGRPGGPHHLEAPGASCERLQEQRARTHPSS